MKRRRAVGLWLPTRASLTPISVDAPGMMLEQVRHDFMSALRGSNEPIEVVEGLDFRRAHIRNGEVVVGDFKFSDLDLFFWFGEISREHDSFDLHLLEAISQKTTVINSSTAVRIALDKLLTQLHLHRAQVPIPNFLVVSRKNVNEAQSAMNGRPFVAKPRLGSFGIGITSVVTHDELVDVVDYSEKDIHFLEEFIDTCPDGFIGINVIGRKVVCGYSKEPSKYRGWKIFDRDRRGGGMVPKKPTPEQERIALSVADAVGLDLFGVDMLTTKDGKNYVIDVNPFPGLYPELNGMTEAAVPQLLADLVLQKLGVATSSLFNVERTNPMRYSLSELPIVFAEAGIVTRETAFGDFDVSYEKLPRGLDLAPLFKGLPDDLCQCPHWGYVLRGRVRMRYRDREELLQAGDCFLASPGHLPIFEEDSEWVVFSPRGEHQKTAEAVRRNKQLLGQ